MDHNENHPLIFPTQSDWRAWLVMNHDKVKNAWLAIKKKNATIVCITYAEAVEEALCFGWIDGVVKAYNNDCFIQRFSQRNPRSIWSKINKDKAIRLIEEGRMTEAGMEKIEEAKKNGKWENAYTTPKKADIPEDLINALKETPHAWEAFTAFPPSHQNMYIYWVNDAKKPETRQRRINEAVKRSLLKIAPGTTKKDIL